MRNRRYSMKDDNKKVEKRLENMKNFYLKAEKLLDNLPDAIPEKTKNILKETFLKKVS